MAKKSIGQFIAALRKANGMTQQDIADRLNVSNKAVSRWERDECAPDISLIPALAEILSVSCDELLRGERILEAAPPERGEMRADRQIKSLISRTLSSFKTLVWIAVALAAVGFICMLGITYAFYKPVLAFAIMLLFEVATFALTAVALSRAKDAVRDNEIFEMADEKSVSHFNSMLGTLSYWAFFALLSSILLSLPLVLVRPSGFHEYVLSAEFYFPRYFLIIAAALLLVANKLKALYVSWITGDAPPAREKSVTSHLCRQVNIIQIGLVVLAGVLFVIAPYFNTNPESETAGYYTVIVLGIAAMVASVIYFIVLTVTKRQERVDFLLSGIRNLCLLPAAMMVANMHQISWRYDPYIDSYPSTKPYSYEVWYMEDLWYAIAYALAVFTVFALLAVLMRRGRKGNFK